MTAAAGAPAIRVDGLVKAYGDRTVLDGVTFDVGTGELFALLGPNGAGKTTTVEVVEGYRQPDRGSVRVLGADPARAGRAHRARVGLMLQEGGVDPRARPDELVGLYASFHADPRDPDGLLDVVGLRAVARTAYRRLSGGERQRLALALALVGRPDLLVLDEPTAGMDPEARAATRSVVQSLRDEGVTILLTTHDLVDVERLADRVAILNHGRIVALDTPAGLVGGATARLRVRFDRALPAEALAAAGAVLARRWPGARVAGVGGDAAAVTVEGVPPDADVVAAIAVWAAEAGQRIVELRAGAGTLEERYLELTGDTGAGGVSRRPELAGLASRAPALAPPPGPTNPP